MEELKESGGLGFLQRGGYQHLLRSRGTPTLSATEKEKLKPKSNMLESMFSVVRRSLSLVARDLGRSSCRK